MSKFRLRRPYIAGFVGGSGVIIWMVIDAIVRQANPLVIPIILGVGAVGMGIGLYIARLVEGRVIKKHGRRNG